MVLRCTYVLLVESHQFEIAVRLLNQGGKVPCWRDQTPKVRSNNQSGEIKHLSSHFCGIFSAIRHHIGFWTHLVADHLFSPNLKEKTELSPFENGITIKWLFIAPGDCQAVYYLIHKEFL